MISNILKNYLSLASFRVSARVLEFLLKTYLFRQMLDLNIIGRLVNLDIILTLPLIISKNILKPSYQRINQKCSQGDAIQSAMNLMSIGIIAQLIIAFPICSLQIYNYSSDTKYFSLCVILYGIAAFFDSISQKYSTQIILKYQYRKSGIIQLCSYLPKTLWLYSVTNYGMIEQYGIAVFGIGQIIYSSLALFMTFFSVQNHTLLIKKMSTGYYISQQSMQVAKSQSILSILKIILQQFQRVFFIWLNISAFSSVYSLISNLGSILVRYVFAPIDEISYNYYSRGTEQESLNTFKTISKLLTIFGVIAIIYGYHFSESFLHIIYGAKWTNQQTIQAMIIYAILLVFLSFNGCIESYVFAKGSPKILSSYSYCWAFSTFIHILSSFALVYYGYGVISVFIGNILSKFVRILFSWKVGVSQHFKEVGQFLKIINPGFSFFILTGIMFFIGFYVKNFGNNFITFGLGCLMLLINLLPILYNYRVQIKQLVYKVKKSE